MTRNTGRIEELERRARAAATLAEGQLLAQDAERLRARDRPPRRPGPDPAAPMLRN